MSSWIKSLIDWLATYIPWLNGNESLFSAIASILTILAAVIAIITFIWKIIVWVFNFIANLLHLKKGNNPANSNDSFPFEIVKTKTELLNYLYPSITKIKLADHAIPYVHRDIHKYADQQIKKHRKVLFMGNSMKRSGN